MNYPSIKKYIPLCLNSDLWDEKIHKLIQIGMSQFSCRMGILPDATHLKVYLLDDWIYTLIEIYTSQIACSLSGHFCCWYIWSCSAILAAWWCSLAATDRSGLAGPCMLGILAAGWCWLAATNLFGLPGHCMLGVKSIGWWNLQSAPNLQNPVFM